MTEFAPQDAAGVAAVVAGAALSGEALTIRGAGTKGGWGRPAQSPHTLALDGLAGIVDHDAAELVLTARAGTTLAAIERSLEASHQILAFEPPDWGALLGTGAGRQTIGGVLSVNAGGPRRATHGAARDHLLGVEAVNGRGEIFRAGGRVVKNVTGYDLPKLFCGAFGTLAVLTEVTLRLLPRPETERTVVVAGLDDAAATALLATALGSPHEVSGACHLPRASAGRLGLDGGAATLIRIEGHAPSVAFRTDAIATLAAMSGAVARHDADVSRALWRDIGDARFFAPLVDHAIWRLSAVASRAPAIVAALGAALSFEHVLDWGGGLIWCAVAPGPEDAGATALRAAVAREGGGTATLLRAPAGLRASLALFDPEPPALASLSARVKDAFDPRRILNPGRLRPDL